MLAATRAAIKVFLMVQKIDQKHSNELFTASTIK